MIGSQVLAQLHRLEDLPELVAALGHESAWEELPLPGWLELRSKVAVTRAAVVGRAGAFTWFGLEADDAAIAAQSAARRLVSRGLVGGVLALSRQSRCLAMAVAFGDAPCINCDLDAPDRLTLARFERVRSAPGGEPLALAARVADALSAEAIGRRFFRRFRAVLDSMTAALPRSCPPEDRHAWALLQLTRVLFLYFVQSKGWLDGRTDFLAREVDTCLSRERRLQQDLLRPLFFGTLNRPASARSALTRKLGRLPFLNGGLFEPHPLEQRWRIDLPNHVWQEAFDTLFERFDFTADEAGRPGLVAPDMLGRVFEGVMEPAERRGSGTFYTPAVLVRNLVHAGLVALLAERMACSESCAERYLAERSPPARRILAGITVLDPAVGSGAFLLGTLELLSRVHAGERSSAPARRRVLRANLFGVDLNPAAVRLTELRLWLAVIADDNAKSPEDVEPLPNLDCLVRQGDSLLDPAGHWPSGRLASRTETAELARLRRALVVSAGADKRPLARELRRAEARAFAAALDSAEAALEREILGRLRDARAPTLFGEPRGLDAVLKRELCRLRKERRAVRETRRRFRRDTGELPWFHFQSQFGDVFARGGFDLVVGNPPWVRAEKLPPAQRGLLATRFQWWRGGSENGFGHRPDLALAFLERAWELTRPGGVVSFLVPAKLATATYGARARHALAATATIRAAADLTATPEAAFDATVYPMALVLGKARAPEGHQVRTVLSPPRAPVPRGIPQHRLSGGRPWPLNAGAALEALDALAQHPRLGERFVCHLGVKTGANAVFLDPPDSVEPELVRWAVRGRDLQPFRAARTRRLLWPCDPEGVALRDLPSGARAHLAPHLGRLLARADTSGGPPWTLFRTGPAAAPYRVAWADLARRLTAVALVASAHDQIPLNTCYLITTSTASTALRVAAWLNSTWLRAAAHLSAPPAANGFARFGAHVVADLPLPDSVLSDEKLEKLAIAGAQGSAIQTELDAITIPHLGLDARAAAALASVDRRTGAHR